MSLHDKSDWQREFSWSILSRALCKGVIASHQIITVLEDDNRAGFTVNRALFEKNVGPVTWGDRPYFSFLKKLATFLVITVALSLLFISLVHSGVAHYFRYAKNLPLLLWGPLFVGPLFGWTCWTCLNAPLDDKQTHRVSVNVHFVFDLC